MQKTTTVMLESGLHARPAATFVQKANQFTSSIMIGKQGKTANAKSILSVMALAATKGSVVVLEADGPDEEAAIAALIDYLSHGETE